MDDAERQAQIENMERLRQIAEKAYDDMYEAYSQRDVDRCYRDAKEYYYDAIGLAERLGLSEESAKMSERLLHIKAVYRHQFFNPSSF